MKKTIISLIVVILIISSSISTTIHASEINIQRYSPTIHKGYNKTFLIGTRNKQLFLRTYKDNGSINEILFTLERSILTYCIYNDNIYILYPSTNQKNVYIIGYVDGNSIIEKFSFKSKTGIGDNTKMNIDKSENFYVLNILSQIEIYNNGEKLATTDKDFQKIINLNGICFGVKTDSLKELSSSGEVKTYKGDFSGINKISDNYVFNPNKNVWYFNGNQFRYLTDIKYDNIMAVGETKEYILSTLNSNLYAYDKNNGQLKYTYNLREVPYGITTNDYSVNVIYNDFSKSTYNTESIFRQDATEEMTFSALSNTNDNSISTLKHTTLDKGDTVIIPQGTTIAKLRKENKYSNCSITFKNKASGIIGSGMKFIVDNGRKQKEYTAIIMGDVTGEGNINSRDIKKMFDHLLDIEKLSEYHTIAGDLDNDGNITNTDLVLLSKLIKLNNQKNRA